MTVHAGNMGSIKLARVGLLKVPFKISVECGRTIIGWSSSELVDSNLFPLAGQLNVCQADDFFASSINFKLSKYFSQLFKASHMFVNLSLTNF